MWDGPRCGDGSGLVGEVIRPLKMIFWEGDHILILLEIQKLSNGLSALLAKSFESHLEAVASRVEPLIFLHCILMFRVVHYGRHMTFFCLTKKFYVIVNQHWQSTYLTKY